MYIYLFKLQHEIKKLKKIFFIKNQSHLKFSKQYHTIFFKIFMKVGTFKTNLNHYEPLLKCHYY